MNQELRARLDRITNVLFSGGVTNPVTYIEQISYLIYLKLLDEREASQIQKAQMMGTEASLLFPAQSKRFRWSQWKHKSGPELREFLRDEVFPFMASMIREAPHVAEYFRDAVMVIMDPPTLKIVIDEVDQIDFRRLGNDIKGDIYEYLLTYLGRIDSKTLGQFRTPRQIRYLMVKMLDPDLGDKVYDPSCGTGGFLIDTLDFLMAKYSEETREIPIYGESWLADENLTMKKAKEKYPHLLTTKKGLGEQIPEWSVLERSLYGLDVSRQMMRIAMMNLVLHGIEKAQLKRANALSELGGLSEEDLFRRYDVILANPPFAGALPKESIRSDLPTQSRKSELLFLGLMLQSLAPGGRCAVIVPEGTLFSSGKAHQELRRKLCQEFNLRAVISLPAGVFKPYAGVKTSVLVFRKPQTPVQDAIPATQKVWFYDLKQDGYDPDKIHRGGRQESPNQNDIPKLLEAWETFRKGQFQEPLGPKAGTVLAAGTEIPQSWWATFEQIEASGFNLTAQAYQPQQQMTVLEEDPIELLEDFLRQEADLSNQAKALLKEIQEVMK